MKSVVYPIIKEKMYAVVNPLCENNNCTDEDLCIMQWGSKNLTQLIGNQEFIDGYHSMNKSVPFDYEVCGDSSEYRLSYTEAKRLLSKTEKGFQSNEKTSLLNFTNSKYLIENLDDFKGIKERFGLDSEKKAEGLSKYYKNTIKTFKLSTNSPELAFFRARFSRDGLQKSLDILKQYVFHNITMKAFSSFYSNNKGKMSCRSYFKGNGNFPSQICNHNILSLDRYEGIVLWTMAYYSNINFDPIPGEFDAKGYIISLLNSSQTQFNFNETILNSEFSNTLKGIQDNFTRYFGCFEAPCNKKFLAELQYYNSSVTDIANSNSEAREYYPNLNVATSHTG